MARAAFVHALLTFAVCAQPDTTGSPARAASDSSMALTQITAVGRTNQSVHSHLEPPQVLLNS
jgi:hypothetical protein